jgi:hypothetical protein
VYSGYWYNLDDESESISPQTKDRINKRAKYLDHIYKRDCQLDIIELCREKDNALDTKMMVYCKKILDVDINSYFLTLIKNHSEWVIKTDTQWFRVLDKDTLNFLNCFLGLIYALNDELALFYKQKYDQKISNIQNFFDLFDVHASNKYKPLKSRLKKYFRYFHLPEAIREEISADYLQIVDLIDFIETYQTSFYDDLIKEIFFINNLYLTLTDYISKMNAFLFLFIKINDTSFENIENAQLKIIGQSINLQSFYAYETKTNLSKYDAKRIDLINQKKKTLKQWKTHVPDWDLSINYSVLEDPKFNSVLEDPKFNSVLEDPKFNSVLEDPKFNRFKETLYLFVSFAMIYQIKVNK